MSYYSSSSTEASSTYTLLEKWASFLSPGGLAGPPPTLKPEPMEDRETSYCGIESKLEFLDWAMHACDKKRKQLNYEQSSGSYRRTVLIQNANRAL